MTIIKRCAITALCGLLTPAAFADPCLTLEKLSQLESREITYLVGRIPPAFRHAVEDQGISLQMRENEAAPSSTCSVSETMTIPKEDIAEVTKLLDRDPAKRILLFSQGYSLPSESRLEASFAVDPTNLEIAQQDILQTGSLGKLRASVEMMYSMLSQSRAETEEPAETLQPWGDASKRKTTKSCLSKFRTKGNLQQACECRSAQLEKHYSARRLDHLEYVLSNPYAMATGAAKDYTIQQESIHARCELSPG